MKEADPTPLIDVLNFGVATISLVVAIFGIGFAIWTLRRGNKNSSAALVYSMHVGFNQAWESFLAEKDPVLHAVKMSNILGLIETSAAIHCDTAMTGSSGELMEEYLRDILGHLASRPELVQEVQKMRHTPTTFVFLDRFIDAMDDRHLASKFIALRGVRPVAPVGFAYERRGSVLASLWHNVKKPDFPGLASIIAERFKGRHTQRSKGHAP